MLTSAQQGGLECKGKDPSSHCRGRHKWFRLPGRSQRPKHAVLQSLQQSGAQPHPLVHCLPLIWPKAWVPSWETQSQQPSRLDFDPRTQAFPFPWDSKATFIGRRFCERKELDWEASQQPLPFPLGGPLVQLPLKENDTEKMQDEKGASLGSYTQTLACSDFKRRVKKSVGEKPQAQVSDLHWQRFWSDDPEEVILSKSTMLVQQEYLKPQRKGPGGPTLHLTH